MNRIASDVATLLGEKLAPECAPEESPFPDLEDRVRILAPGILQRLLLECNTDIIAEAESFAPDVTINSDGTVETELPADFLRLVAVKMSDWEKPVEHLTGPADPEFKFQSDPQSGIRGNPNRPVAITGRNKEGGKILALFSSHPSARLQYLLYIRQPAITSSDTMKVPDSLYYSLITETAKAIEAR